MKIEDIFTIHDWGRDEHEDFGKLTFWEDAGLFLDIRNGFEKKKMSKELHGTR